MEKSSREQLELEAETQRVFDFMRAEIGRIKQSIAALSGVVDEELASVRSAGLQPNNQSLLAGKEDEFFPALYDAAMKAVTEDGAEVIMLGSTTMHEAHTWLAERLPVPILNPGPLTYRMADAAIRLQLSHSRASYPAPRAPAAEVFRRMGEAADVLNAQAAKGGA